MISLSNITVVLKVIKKIIVFTLEVIALVNAYRAENSFVTFKSIN